MNQMTTQHADRSDPVDAEQTPGSGAMFDAIATRYDLLNRLMSLGLDARWRRQTVAAMQLDVGAHILDVAAGTLDVALTVALRVPQSRVTALDPSHKMLARGQQKAISAGVDQRITTVVADACALPFADATFDGAVCSFGIRNIPDRPQALREMLRVCRPGTRVAILELTEPRTGILAPLARLHVHYLVPRLGALLSGSREYRYLQQSIAAFPPPEEFVETMAAAGLLQPHSRRLGFGAVHLFVGTVPETVTS